MSSLYVDRKNVTLKADGEALVFTENNGARVGTVPLRQISRVILRGDVQLSASLLGKLGEHGIGVVALSGRKGRPSLFMGCPHNDAARRIAQYRCSLDEVFCLEQARYVVTAKLEGQRRLLMTKRDACPAKRLPLSRRIRQIESCLVRLDDPKTLEQCLSTIKALIDPKTDDVRCYALPQHGLKISLGHAVLPDGIHWTGLPPPL